MNRRSTVTIYVRHYGDCKYTGRNDRAFSRDCLCVKWLRYSLDGRQYREAADTRAWAVAEEKRSELQARLDGGDVLKEKTLSFNRRITIKAAVDTFLTSKKDEGCGPATLTKLSHQLGRFEKWMVARGRLFPSDITPTDLIEYRATWDGMSGVTKQKQQQNIRGWIKASCEPNLALLRALKPIKLSKADIARLEPQPFTEAEIAKLLSHAKTPTMTALVHLQVSTGLAITDALQLERASIDGGWLRIRRQKTDRPVEQKLHDSLHQELLRLAGPRYVFEGGVSRLSVRMAELRDVMKRAGLWIKGNLSHRFRDTAVDYWIGQGCSLLEVASLLGDTVPTVEKHYRRLLSVRMKDRLEKIPTRTW